MNPGLRISTTALLLAATIAFPSPSIGPAAAATSFASAKAVRSEAVVRGWLEEARAAGANVDAGSIDWDAGSDTVKIQRLVVVPAVAAGGPPAPKFSVDTLEISGAAANASGFAANRLVARNARVENGGAVASIREARLESVVLPKIDASRRDPNRPVQTMVETLRDLSRTAARTAVLEGIESKDDPSVKTGTTTIARVEATGLGDGRMAKLAITGIASTDDKAGRSSRIASIAIDGVDLNPALRLFDAKTYSGSSAARPWASFVSSIAVGQIEGRDPTSHLQVGEIRLSNVRLRPFLNDPTTILENAAKNPDHFIVHKEDAAQFVTALSDFLAIDTIAVRAMANDDGAPNPARRTGFAKLDVKELDPRGASLITLSELQSRDGNTGFTVQSIEIGRLRLVDGRPRRPNDPPAPLVPTFQTADIKDVRVVGPGVTADMTRLHLETSDHVGSVPTRVVGQIENLVAPSEAIGDPQLRALMADLGVKTLTVNLDLAGDWSEPRGEITLEQAQLSIGEVGALALSGSVVGIPRAAIEQPDAFFTQAADAGLKQLRLTFTDAGLTRRWLARVAEANKQPVDTIRKAITANVPAMFAPIADANARNRIIFAAVGFLNDPKTLDLSTTIITPVPIATLLATASTAPWNLPGLLKLDAAANRKR